MRWLLTGRRRRWPTKLPSLWNKSKPIVAPSRTVPAAPVTDTMRESGCGIASSFNSAKVDPLIQIQAAPGARKAGGDA